MTLRKSIAPPAAFGLATVAAASGLFASGPAVASQAAGDITCVVTSHVTYDPGLTLVPRQQAISYRVTYSGCTSLTGSAVTSGERSGTFTDVRSCLALPGPATQTFRVDWNTGPDSRVTGTTQSVDAGGQVVHTIRGVVDSGQFVGSLFIEETNQLSLDLLECAAGGVKSQSAAGVVTLV